MLTPFQFGFHAEQDASHAPFAIARGTWRGHDARLFVEGILDTISFLDHAPFGPPPEEGDSWNGETKLTDCVS